MALWKRGQLPPLETPPDHAETLVDRAATVAVLVDVLKHDPAWSSLSSDEARRTAARRLLSVKWAVRAGRRGVGDMGR